MVVRKDIFVALFSLGLCWTSTALDTCYKVNSCQCVFSDGRYIDLMPLASLNSQPKWKDNYDNFYNSRYSYNPCYSFTEGTCQDVAVCQVNNVGQYLNCGRQNSSVFLADASTGLLAIEYSDGITRTSRVLLNCITTAGDTLEIHGEAQTGHYIFKLNSQHCCPKQGPTTDPPSGDNDITSVGTYLLIGFSAVVVLVILIGLIGYSCVGSSQGREEDRVPIATSRGRTTYSASATMPPPYDYS